MALIDGYILAGGASSRMGRDKAALRLGGASFVERVAAALRPFAREVYLVSSRHEPTAWGLPVVRDLIADSGAMGGLHAALKHADARRGADAGAGRPNHDGGRIAVVSCDLPFVTCDLLRRLASLCVEGVDAVAPVQEDGRAQPLCAVYESARCAAAADELLRAGELRPRALLRRVRTRWVAFEELADLAGAPLFFMNVNTPEEYERARLSAGG